MSGVRVSFGKSGCPSKYAYPFQMSIYVPTEQKEAKKDMTKPIFHLSLGLMIAFSLAMMATM